jgi:hypothetical protein
MICSNELENAKRRDLQDSANAEYVIRPPSTSDLSPFEPTRPKVTQFITFKNLDVGFPSNCF